MKTATLTLEELGKLSSDLDMYMDWAQVWHKQAGGYTASDTFLTMMRMENDCVSDGPADTTKSTRSAEGPFAARND